MRGSHSISAQQFADRYEAGRVLGGLLSTRWPGHQDLVVLALPRGGVPVGHEVARALNAPLDVFVVRKLGTPGHRELAMGAIASGGVRVMNEEVVTWYGLTTALIERVVEEEEEELRRREHAFREGRAPTAVDGKVTVLVDDGLATGSTMKAAVKAVRQLHPSYIVVAVPVGARETCEAMRALADEVVCARTPEPFDAVGLWYNKFDQTSDEEVRALLRAHQEV